MNILYLHQHFAVREGSTGTRSYEFARLLQKRGHEVTITCGAGALSGLASQNEKLIEEREVSGVKILQLGVPYTQEMGYLRRLLAFFWFMLLATWVAVRRRDADIVFATSTPLTIAIPGIIAACINRQPFVFEVRDLWPEVPIALGVLRNPVLIFLARGLERLAYRCATHVVALSPGMKAGIIRTGVPAGKASVIPNACDNDLFDVPVEVGQAFRARHPFLMDRPLVVYTGAFGVVNGLDYLVRIARYVRSLDERVAFLLVGTGSERQALHGLAQELGVLNKTLWLMDSIPRRQIPEVLSAATVATSMVTPNPVLWHNSANKFFDALAAGRPVAINHGGWLADLLRESGAGIVLPPDDVEKAAEVLVDFLRSQPRLERAQQAARDLAREQFDRTRLAGQLERVLLDAKSA